jgi:hypothetical protein
MHVARGELRKETKSDGEEDKRSRGNSIYLWNFYKNKQETRMGRKLAIKPSKKSGRLKKKI